MKFEQGNKGTVMAVVAQPTMEQKSAGNGNDAVKQDSKPGKKNHNE